MGSADENLVARFLDLERRLVPRRRSVDPLAVRLEVEASTTRMTVTIRCASAEHLEQMVRLGVDSGTDRTLDNLVAHVTRNRKAS